MIFSLNKLGVEHHMHCDHVYQALVIQLHSVIEAALKRLEASLVHWHEKVQEDHTLKLEGWVAWPSKDDAHEDEATEDEEAKVRQLHFWVVADALCQHTIVKFELFACYVFFIL